jgi:curved DNA-binding protein CbpA
VTFDPYTELDLPRDAPASSIKRAYRKRAKQTHPDSGGSKQKFQKTTRAYLILSDPARRSKYDATGDAEELQPDNSVAMAIGIIVGFFAYVAQAYAQGKTLDPAKSDLVEIARNQFCAQIKELENRKRPIENAAATLRRIEKKLKGKNDFLREAIRRQAAATAEPISKIEREIQAHKDALTLIKDFSFDYDRDAFSESLLQRRSLWNVQGT